MMKNTSKGAHYIAAFGCLLFVHLMLTALCYPLGLIVVAILEHFGLLRIFGPPSFNTLFRIILFMYAIQFALPFFLDYPVMKKLGFIDIIRQARRQIRN